MESLSRSLNVQQAFQTEPNFDKYARQILENSKTVATVATPTKITDFLQEFGATFINSIQLQNFQKSLHTNRSSSIASASASTVAAAAAAATATAANGNLNAFAFNSSSIASASASAATALNAVNNSNEMEIEFIPNHIIIDSSSFETMDELQKQLEYDKFMNEVWIGIVLTLILISMIFCVCSCFLYHQFRTWKRNYHSTVVQVNSADIESHKLESELDDPVPEYTLVSGLPSYEAALELLQKTPPKSCLIVYPSVFNVFNKNERTVNTGQLEIITPNATSNQHQHHIQQRQQQQQQQNVIDITTPLLSNSTTIYPKDHENNAEPCNDSNPTIMTNTELTENLTVCSVVNEKELLELLNETETETMTVTIRDDNAIKQLEEVIIAKSDKRK